MPTTAPSATNGEGAWVAAAITPAARQREAGQFLSRRMEAWRPRLILFSAQFEFRTATTLLCAATVSFRSPISRFIPAISGGTPDRNTCRRESPFELQQNVCISACPAARGRQARFLKRRRLRCGTSFREGTPPFRSPQVYDRLPAHSRRSRPRSAMSSVRRFETSLKRLKCARSGHSLGGSEVYVAGLRPLMSARIRPMTACPAAPLTKRSSASQRVATGGLGSEIQKIQVIAMILKWDAIGR
jgi:hypothetical protein